jgi:hypothetical protein
MPKFKVWRDAQEQWDANDIDPPEMTVDALDPPGAAEKFADQRNEGGDNIVECVVQDEAGNYFEIEVGKTWEVRVYRPTTLEKLCSP